MGDIVQLTDGQGLEYTLSGKIYGVYKSYENSPPVFVRGGRISSQNFDAEFHDLINDDDDKLII